MLSHQKLHESIFLPDKLSGTPFARLPDEWIKEIEARREAIKLPRDQDKAAHTFVTIRLPSDPRIASETVRNTSHKSEASLSNGSLFKPEFTLPAEAVESNPIDYHEIPALIDGVVRGTNTRQYLECLEMLAYTGKRLFIAVGFFSSRNIPDIGKETIQKINGDQFASMIRQICGDEMYARLATRLVSVGGMSGQLSESLPSPSAARTSPPRLPDLNFDSAPNLVDPAPTTGDKELTPAGRSEHARSDTGHCEVGDLVCPFRRLLSFEVILPSHMSRWSYGPDAFFLCIFVVRACPYYSKFLAYMPSASPPYFTWIFLLSFVFHDEVLFNILNNCLSRNEAAHIIIARTSAGVHYRI